jgi:hypothetical protein
MLNINKMHIYKNGCTKSTIHLSNYLVNVVQFSEGVSEVIINLLGIMCNVNKKEVVTSVTTS